MAHTVFGIVRHLSGDGQRVYGDLCGADLYRKLVEQHLHAPAAHTVRVFCGVCVFPRTQALRGAGVCEHADRGSQRSIVCIFRKKHLGFLHLCARAHRGRHGGMCAELHTGEEHTVRRGSAGIRRAEYNDCGEHGALLVRGDLSELDRLWLRPTGLLPVHAGMDRAQPQ